MTTQDDVQARSNMRPTNKVVLAIVEAIEFIGPYLGGPFAKLAKTAGVVTVGGLTIILILFVVLVGGGIYAWANYDWARYLIPAVIIAYIISRIRQWVGTIAYSVLALGILWQFLMFVTPPLFNFETPQFPEAVKWVITYRPWKLFLGDDQPRLAPAPTATPTLVPCEWMTMYDNQGRVVMSGHPTVFSVSKDVVKLCVPKGKTVSFIISATQKKFTFTEGNHDVPAEMKGQQVELQVR